MEEINRENQKKIKKIVNLYEESQKEIKGIHKRLTDKIKSEKEYAISKFAKDCLETLDNFDRCFE